MCLMAKLIGRYETEMIEPACTPGAARWGVLISLDNDISTVFPYLNAVMDSARYDHENQVLILREPDQAYAFRPTEIRIARANDRLQAQQLTRDIIERVNRIWQERDSIVPRYTERRLPAVMDIFKLLPRTNCKRCGYATCMAFAADLRAGTVQLEQCPPLSQIEYTENKDEVLNLFSLG